jgi:predicted ABC-type ATPase
VSTPVLHVLAGPNGSGKSTFAHRVLLPATHLPFVNADEIAAKRWPGDEQAHAYQAAAAATAARERALAARRSFVTETVLSHPSKRDLVAQAQRAGYRVELHVVMVPVEVTVARVAFRVEHGGHDVPETKIRERYERLWPLVVDAATITARATFYDNTRARTPFVPVARVERGRLTGPAAWPTWTPFRTSSF